MQGEWEWEQGPGRRPAPLCACNVNAQHVGATPRQASLREEGQREVDAGEAGARAGQTGTEEAAEAK